MYTPPPPTFPWLTQQEETGRRRKRRGLNSSPDNKKISLSLKSNRRRKNSDFIKSLLCSLTHFIKVWQKATELNPNETHLCGPGAWQTLSLSAVDTKEPLSIKQIRPRLSQLWQEISSRVLPSLPFPSLLSRKQPHLTDELLCCLSKPAGNWAGPGSSDSTSPNRPARFVICRMKRCVTPFPIKKENLLSVTGCHQQNKNHNKKDESRNNSDVQSEAHPIESRVPTWSPSFGSLRCPKLHSQESELQKSLLSSVWLQHSTAVHVRSSLCQHHTNLSMQVRTAQPSERVCSLLKVKLNKCFFFL